MSSKGIFQQQLGNVLRFAALSALLAGCSDHHEHEHEHEHEHGAVPAPYDDYANPTPDDPEATSRGNALYAANCAGCHGREGRGDGELSADLDPAPPDLGALVARQDITDGYLYWRIAEGGSPMMSSMPAWKDQMSQDQLWDIITFLYSLPQ